MRRNQLTESPKNPVRFNNNQTHFVPCAYDHDSPPIA